RSISEPLPAGSGHNLDSEMPQRYVTLAMRPSQMAEFSRVEVQKFKSWMLVHLNKFFPTECQSAGEMHIKETIQYGIKRAASYGITSKSDVCKYIDLMVVFGRDFDTDRGLPWASEVLSRRNSSSIKTCLLLQAAQRHLNQG